MSSHDESAIFEFLERFPDGNRTHAEPLDQFPFDEALPGTKVSGDDVALDDFDDVCPQGFRLEGAGRRDDGGTHKFNIRNTKT